MTKLGYYFVLYQTTTFLLLSTSNNNRLLIFPTTFCLCQHQFLLMSNSNFLLTTPLANHVSRNQFVNYCLYVFFNNLYHPFHLIFQQPFTFLQPLSSTIFVLSLQLLSTSNHSTHFFSNQPFNQTILFQLINFIFLFSIDPPWNFLVRGARNERNKTQQ